MSLQDVGSTKAKGHSRGIARRREARSEPGSPSASSMTSNYSPSKPSRLSYSTGLTPESADESEHNSTLSPFESSERNGPSLHSELGQMDQASEDDEGNTAVSPIPFHRHPDIVAALESIHREHNSVWQDEAEAEQEVVILEDEPNSPLPHFDSVRIARNRKNKRISLRNTFAARRESLISGETLIDELASLKETLPPSSATKVKFAEVEVEEDWEEVEKLAVVGPNTYWPLTVRARYHPRTVAHRAATKVMAQGLVAFIWFRFLFVLVWAVVKALKRGPEDILDRRARIKRDEERLALSKKE